MKKILLNPSILSSLLLIFMMFLFSSCGGSEEDETSKPKTLFETLDGTKWENINEDNLDNFYIFKNNLNDPFTSWEGTIDDICMSMYDVDYFETFEILENFETVFEYKFTEPDEGGYFIITIRKSGEKLLEHMYLNEGEFGVSEKDFEYKISDLDFGSFVSCPRN